MIAPMESLTPHLDSPLAEPMELLRKLAKEDMDRAKELHISEGFLLKNLEADSKLNLFLLQNTSTFLKVVEKKVCHKNPIVVTSNMSKSKI